MAVGLLVELLAELLAELLVELLVGIRLQVAGGGLQGIAGWGVSGGERDFQIGDLRYNRGQEASDGS